jgi:hypothetical protein
MRLKCPCGEEHALLDARRRGLALTEGERILADAQEYRCQDTSRMRRVTPQDEETVRLWG